VKSVEYNNTVPGEAVGAKMNQDMVEDIIRGGKHETAARKTQE
jgi:hypothetical protein